MKLTNPFPYRGLISKRPLVSILLSLIFGMLFSKEKSVLFVLPWISLFFFPIAGIYKGLGKRANSLLLLLMVLAFCCGNLQKGWEEKQFLNAEENLRDCTAFTGKLQKKEIKNDTVIYYLTNCSGKRKMTEESADEILALPDLMVYPKEDSARIGDILLIKGSTDLPKEAANEGNYDEKAYLKGNRICGKVKEAEVRILRTTLNPMGEDLWKLRRRLVEIYTAELPNEEGGILSALAVGDKSQLAVEAKDLFQLAGFSHILAISGLHISLVGKGAYQRLKKHSRLFGALVSSLVVVLYGQLCGNSISCRRAVGMYLLTMIATCLGEAYDPISAVSLCGIMELSFLPSSLESVSFVFSYGAIMAIHLFALPMKERLEEGFRIRWEKTHRKDRGRRWQANWKESLLLSLVVSLDIQLGTLPIVAHYFYEVPTYVLFLNFLLLPLLPLLLGCGLLGGLLFLTDFNLLQALGNILLGACHIFLYLYESACDRVNRLPLSRWITGSTPDWLMGLFWLSFFLMLTTFYLMEKSDGKDRKRERTFCVRTGLRGISVMTFFLCLMALLLFPEKNDAEVSFLDVGQGDGIYIHCRDGDNIMIDGGSTTVTMVGKYRILPFLKYRGIRSVDYWFLTHPDEDHYSGLLEALQAGYRIRCLVLAESIEKTDSLEGILAAAEENHTAILYTKPGEKLISGKAGLTVLFPAADDKTEGTNEKSLCLWLTEGEEDALFTGDIGSDQEEELLESELFCSLLKKRGSPELYKAAHHGSKGSNSLKFLEAIAPDVTVISAGVNNSYGHPSPETLQRLEETGCRIRRTDQEGQIKILFGT